MFAQFLLNALYQGGSTPADLINDFILNAKPEDAGVSAARQVLDIDLVELLARFLGEGDWEPDIRERIERARSEPAAGDDGGAI